MDEVVDQILSLKRSLVWRVLYVRCCHHQALHIKASRGRERDSFAVPHLFKNLVGRLLTCRTTGKKNTLVTDVDK